MSQVNFDGNVNVQGALRCNTFTAPASCIGNTNFTASDPLGVTKQVHQYSKSLQQVHGSAASAERRIIHRGYGAGTTISVRAGVSVACIGDSTITVDVYKNGTTILSAPIVLDNSNTAFAQEAGTISVAGYSAGDDLEVVVTVSAGTGTLGQGLHVDVVLNEAQS